MSNPCFLVLTDGTVFQGESFGADPISVSALGDTAATIETVGEVVFNTGMSGYHEILTDPSYSGQIVMMTYPHIGNYGVDDVWCEVANFPENRPNPVQVAGYVVRSVYTGPVPEGRMRLPDYLATHGISGISGIDTRALTLRLRDKGSSNGMIVANGKNELTEAEINTVREFLAKAPSMEGLDLLPYVGVDKPVSVDHKKPVYSIGVLDCGTKANIVRELSKRGASMIIYPSSTPAEVILKANHDGIMVSNGPGDPGVLTSVITEVGKLLGKLPVFGICLGHQLICLALGAKTEKMKFGHHGINHPVRDEFSKNVIVTSQNHGFMVNENTLPKDIDVWFRNANDGTLEGISCPGRKIKTTQFHPEAAPGPVDSSWIFDEFIGLIQGTEE